MLQEVTAKANVWLGEGYDAETRAEVQRMLDADDRPTSSNASTAISNSGPAVYAA